MIRERTLVPTPEKRLHLKSNIKKKLDNLSSKNACLEKEHKDAYIKISKLEQELKVTKKIHLCDKKGIANLQEKLLEENKREFYPFKFSAPATSFPVFMWLDYR